MKKNLRSAYSMIELVFAITVLGIVSSITTEIIIQVYEAHITQKASHNSSVKTELASMQIANRLAYAIPDTVIGKRADGTFVPITDLNGTDYVILEWVGYDSDSFGATSRPAWSGMVDLDPSTQTSLITPGSILGNANRIIGNLSLGNPKGLAGSALFFTSMYSAMNIGYNGNTTGLVGVSAGAGSTLTVPSLAGRFITEQYKLAWTAYALVPQANATGSSDLLLYYNYRPWNGETYLDGRWSVLIRNISVFKFMGTTTTVRFKLCQQETIGDDFLITTCKEKAVIR